MGDPLYLTGNNGCFCHVDKPSWCRAHLSKWMANQESCEKILNPIAPKKELTLVEELYEAQKWKGQYNPDIRWNLYIIAAKKIEELTLELETLKK